jgi:hypothetical protein
MGSDRRIKRSAQSRNHYPNSPRNRLHLCFVVTAVSLRNPQLITSFRLAYGLQVFKDGAQVFENISPTDLPLLRIFFAEKVGDGCWSHAARCIEITADICQSLFHQSIVGLRGKALRNGFWSTPNPD